MRTSLSMLRTNLQSFGPISAPCFRREQLLEELLVGLVRAGSRDPWAQAAGELGGERAAGLRREAFAAGQGGAHDRQLVLADGGRVERAGVLPRRRDVRRRRRGAAVADHERAGGVIAE